jgi:ACS family D-galactonate transporter-like MFS transporter
MIETSTNVLPAAEARDTTPRFSARTLGIVAFLMALVFISHFNRASMASAGDERIMKQFDISPKSMGVLYSAFLIVYTVFMIPGGWFIDRCGPRIAMACMGVGSAIFCAVTGVIGFGFIAAPHVWAALFIVRSLMGLLSVPLHPGAARAVGNWLPPERQAFANGIINGAAVLAYAAVHPIFGGLIDRVDWPIAFVITGTVTGLLALTWFVFARDYPSDTYAKREIPPSSAGNESTAAPAFKINRSIILLTLSYSAVGYFQYLFFYWLHYYFDEILKMEKGESRFYAGLPNLAMAFCMPLGGWITGRITRLGGSRTLVPKFGMTVSSLLLVLGILAHERAWIVLWFTLSLGVLGLCEASFWTIIVQLGGRKGGTSAAIMNTGGNGIGLLAPMITPFVAARFGWLAGIGLGAVVGLLGALCWFGIKEREPAAMASPVQQLDI